MCFSIALSGGGLLAQLAVAALDLRNIFLVGRAAPFPAHQHLVPTDRAILVPPALLGLVEAHWKWAVDQIDLLLGVEVGGNAQTKGLTQRHRSTHPCLAQHIVRRAFKPVAKLIVVFL